MLDSLVSHKTEQICDFLNNLWATQEELFRY